MQNSPPPQFCSLFHERCAQCWIEWKINFTIFIFSGMTVYTIYQKFTEQKNNCSKCSHLQERFGLLWKLLFSSWICFLQLLVFEIWSILRTWGHMHQNRISQKFKSHKKTHELKNLFQSNAHLSCKLGHFWTIFFGRWYTWKSRWHTSILWKYN